MLVPPEPRGALGMHGKRQQTTRASSQHLHRGAQLLLIDVAERLAAERHAAALLTHHELILKIRIDQSVGSHLLLEVLEEADQMRRADSRDASLRGELVRLGHGGE